MKRQKQWILAATLFFCGATIMLTSCTDVADNPVNPKQAYDAADEVANETFIHEQYMDRTVKPGDSFWQFALGSYLKKPDDFAGTMATAMVRQMSEMNDVESMKTYGSGHTMQLIIGPVHSAEDEKAVLDGVLARMKSGNDISKADVIRNIGKLADLGYGALLNHDVWFIDGILRYTVIPGFACESKSGTKTTNEVAEIVKPILQDKLGIDTDSEEGARLLKNVVDIEDWIGKFIYEWRSTTAPDPVRVSTTSGDELTNAYREAFHIDDNTYQLPGVAKVFDLIDQYDVATLQTYLRYYACSKLSKAMFCSGQQASNVYQQINAQSQSLFLEYHKAMLYRGDKWKLALNLLEEMRTVFAHRIERLDWLSDATKAKAIEKLQAMGMNVKPETTFNADFRLTGKTPVEDLVQYKEQVDDYLRNVLAGKLGRDYEWEYLLTSPNGMGLDAANAGYDPNNQLIIYPFFLREEFFPSDEKKIVVFYASLMSFGHEMTHGFDNFGATYDAIGRKSDWWTAEDKAKFEARQQVMIDRYNELEVLPGVSADGKNTLGENIADYGGFMLAWEMWNNKLQADGLTGEELRHQQREFFLAVANLWKQLSDEETLLNNLKTDVHSANHNRVNGVVRLIDEWYDLFGVKPGDKLYVEPEKRVKIW